MAASVPEWKPIDENYAAGEFTARLFGWSRERRFAVIREKIREGKEAVGRKLIDVPGYAFRMWVADREGSPEELWREYNGRAAIEQRIEELKNDLGADEFCTQKFWATESAFLAVLLTFNLLSLYQQNVTPQAGYRRPGTLRTAVFLCGAIPGRSGRQAVLHLSTARGGLDKHKPLIDAVLHWPKSTSPKLDRAGPSPCGSDGFLQQNPVPT
jgi:DNA-directed RNA polymerase subunit N (RpoN/RPB10)